MRLTESFLGCSGLPSIMGCGVFSISGVINHASGCDGSKMCSHEHIYVNAYMIVYFVSLESSPDISFYIL